MISLGKLEDPAWGLQDLEVLRRGWGCPGLCELYLNPSLASLLGPGHPHSGWNYQGLLGPPVVLARGAWLRNPSPPASLDTKEPPFPILLSMCLEPKCPGFGPLQLRQFLRGPTGSGPCSGRSTLRGPLLRDGAVRGPVQLNLWLSYAGAQMPPPPLGTPALCHLG